MEGRTPVILADFDLLELPPKYHVHTVGFQRIGSPAGTVDDKADDPAKE